MGRDGCDDVGCGLWAMMGVSRWGFYTWGWGSTD